MIIKLPFCMNGMHSLLICQKFCYLSNSRVFITLTFMYRVKISENDHFSEKKRISDLMLKSHFNPVFTQSKILGPIHSRKKQHLFSNKEVKVLVKMCILSCM